MSTNIINVLIPVYNNEATLARCIESVIEQTFTHWELILFMDGCTDGSLAVAKKYGNEQIKIVESDENRGIAAARNKLAKMAKGDYVAWLDADDFMLPERLQTQLDYLISNPNIGICGTAAILRNNDVKEVHYLPTHEWIQAFQFFKCGVLFPTIMTRNFYDNKNNLFDENFGSRASDFEWLYRVGLQQKISNLSSSLTSYYVSSSKELDKKREINNFDNKVANLLRVKINDLLDADVNDELIMKLHYFLLDTEKVSEEDSNLLAELLLKLKKANAVKNTHKVSCFNSIILFHLFRIRKYGSLKQVSFYRLLKTFELKSFLYLFRIRSFHH